MRRVFGAAFTMAATVAVGLSWATIGNAACGKVTIAEMNWASAELMANVDKIILSTFAISEAEAQFISDMLTLPHAAFPIVAQLRPTATVAAIVNAAPNTRFILSSCFRL